MRYRNHVIKIVGKSEMPISSSLISRANAVRSIDRLTRPEKRLENPRDGSRFRLGKSLLNA